LFWSSGEEGRGKREWEKGRGKREKGMGKREEGMGKREEGMGNVSPERSESPKAMHEQGWERLRKE
jgi:hypothetical protein